MIGDAEVATDAWVEDIGKAWMVVVATTMVSVAGDGAEGSTTMMLFVGFEAESDGIDEEDPAITVATTVWMTGGVV